MAITATIQKKDVKGSDRVHRGTLNLGTGTMTPVRKVVELLRELSGCPIEDRDVAVQGPMRFQCDRATIDRIIEWQPRVDVEEGVRRTWEAMRSYAAR